MNSLDSMFIHSCEVISTTQDHRLNFSSGAVAFTVGELLTGAVSGAAGIIKSVSVSSGSWASGNAAGYLILYNVSGTFGNETIHDEGPSEAPGSATASGPAIPLTNGIGTPQTTTSSSPYSCLFSTVSVSGGIQNYQPGNFITANNIVFLPNDAVVQEGDNVTSSNQGYNKNYKVTKVTTLYNKDGSIDHIEATLEVITKK